MAKQEQLNALESRQLELQAIMAKSDAHASKCAKLGLKFNEAYPSDLAEYQVANQEYNDNEIQIEALKAEIAAEPEPEHAAPEEE